MRTKSMGRTWVLAGVAALALAAPAAAAGPRRVLNVITVKVKGDRDAYLEKVKRFTAISKRVEAGGTMRVWRFTLAGEQTGLIAIATEYPSLEALAKGTAKIQADEEWTRLVNELDASGTREVVGNRLLEEITP
jgi:hypothetical protein